MFRLSTPTRARPRISKQSDKDILPLKGRNISRFKKHGSYGEDGNGGRGYSFDSLNRLKVDVLEKTSRKNHIDCLESLSNISDWFGKDFVSVSKEDSVVGIIDKCFKEISRIVEPFSVESEAFIEKTIGDYGIDVIKQLREELPSNYEIPNAFLDDSVFNTIKWIENDLIERSGEKNSYLEAMPDNGSNVAMIVDEGHSDLVYINVYKIVSEVLNEGKDKVLAMAVLRSLEIMGVSGFSSIGYNECLLSEILNMGLYDEEEDEQEEEGEFEYSLVIDELKAGMEKLGESLTISMGYFDSDFNLCPFKLITEYIENEDFSDSNFYELRDVLESISNLKGFNLSNYSKTACDLVDWEEDYADGVIPTEQSNFMYFLSPSFQNDMDNFIQYNLNCHYGSLMGENFCLISTVKEVFEDNQIFEKKRQMLDSYILSMHSLVRILEQ